MPVKDLCKGFMKWHPSVKSPKSLTSIKEPNKVRNVITYIVINDPEFLNTVLEVLFFYLDLITQTMQFCPH